MIGATGAWTTSCRGQSYDCNKKKKVCPAEEFLRWLYRERRLRDAELSGRLRALDELAAGKLKPTVSGQGR